MSVHVYGAHAHVCVYVCRSSIFRMALQGAVWVMEFSICGRLLATAGQDSVVVSDWSFGRLCVAIKGYCFVGLQRVWVLRTAYIFFHELQSQYQRLGKLLPPPSLSPSLPQGLILLEFLLLSLFQVSTPV